MSTWRLSLRDPRGMSHDLHVQGAVSSTTAALVEELASLGFRARPLGVNGRALTDATTLLDAGLQSGDTMSCGSLGAPETLAGVGWYLVAVSGPDSGRWARLSPDEPCAVGRSGNGLALDDPLLSARHCEVTSSETGVVIADCGSTNGTYVEGVELSEPAGLEPGRYVQAGSTVLTVVEITADDIAVLGAPDGPDRVLPRQYRRALSPLPASLDAPRAFDDDHSAGGSGWWRALIPLVTGVGFAVITGRWIFLLIIAIAPVIVGFDAWRRARGTSAKEARKRQRIEAALADFRQRLAELRRVELRRSRNTAAIGGLSTLCAMARMSTLWERSPGDDDFLTVGVGLATMPSPIVASGAEPDGTELMWGTPVSTNLVLTGSLAIVGETARSRAVARGLVLSLAAHHSPGDLRISVVTDDSDGAEWGFSRWLPHAFLGDQGCRVAADADSRARLLAATLQLLETRRELASQASATEGVPMPVHLIIIDNTSLVSSTELTELLVDGPALGIVGLTLDSRLAPEGVGATLTVTGAADTCVFQSRHQPRVEGLAIALLAPDIAERAARRLAGLRAAVAEEADVAGGVVHLVDLIGGPPLDADTIRERWSSISPHTEVTVGMAANTPMRVDIVGDGPHGLVGGTSGSGKTEFLKTLFCALAINNHPDDLSIVIVDFKGGVDHEAVKPLPHVIDVATNLDIEQFRRTVVLLKAESRRRQDLLASAGASNIDSYRMVRRSRPDLPSLPRLLVVVDEFGELLASEGGREQLKELESITRIGRALGLHLLLVTQNFDGNLPPQIDANAGMRVCLRVQKPAHSKAVLDSGVAATISDRHVGRAFARFHGRDLTEFQTARVAGRRRDLVTTASPVSARMVPFATLATPPATQRPEDVPVEETDMYVLLQSISAAAAATGWTKSSVPWPASLPEHVSLAALAERCETGVPVGVADVPTEQRRAMVTLTDRDQQVVFLGGPNAPLADLLAMYATSLAITHSADDVHLYAIDLAGRGLASLAELPHCGAVAVRNEALALRIIRWVAQTAAERKVMIASTGSSTVWDHAKVTGNLPPQIVLMVSGADSVLNSDGSSGNLLGPLLSLISEAVGVRIQIVLSGLPKIVAHRLGMNIERRFVFRLADPAELGTAGVAKSAAADLRVDRRAVEPATGQVVQFAQVAEPGGSEGSVIGRLAVGLAPARLRPPRRFADVSWPLPWEQVSRRELVAPPHLLAPLPIGIGAEDGEWMWIDAEEDGPVFAVTGSPKSGRSLAMAAIARLAVTQGFAVVNVMLSRRSPLATSGDRALACRVDPLGLADALETTPGRVLILLDDLQRLLDPTCIEMAMAYRDRVTMIVAGSPDLLSSRVGVLRSLPNASSGLLLAPSGAHDGAAVGLRRLAPEWMSNPRPGRGLLAIAGEAAEIQMPLVPVGVVAGPAAVQPGAARSIVQ